MLQAPAPRVVVVQDLDDPPAVGSFWGEVNGNVHTNGIENFWSLLKRSIRGTYVSIEPFHLFRYLDEQAFRYNTRKIDDAERVARAIQRADGKRLTYADHVSSGT